jgi:hypothetical protein
MAASVVAGGSGARVCFSAKRAEMRCEEMRGEPYSIVTLDDALVLILRLPAERCGPQTANGTSGRCERAHTPVIRATPQAARVLRPLQRVDRGIEARGDEFLQVTTPTFSGLHDRLRLMPITKRSSEVAVPTAPRTRRIDREMLPFSDSAQEIPWAAKSAVSVSFRRQLVLNVTVQ